MHIRKDYKKLFSYLKPPELPEGLFERVMSSVAREKSLRSARARIALFSLWFAGSATAFVAAVKMLGASLAESGFAGFVSLAFFDTSAVLTSFGSYAFALLESLPVISVILFFTVIFAALGSLRLMTKKIKIFPISLTVN